MVSQKIYLALERARQQQLQQHIELYLAFSSRPCPGESVHWCLHHLRAARRILGRVIILSSVSISQVIWGSPGVILTDFLGGKSMGGWLLMHLIFLHFKQQWEVAVIRHRLVCVNRTSELAVACWSFPKYLIFEVLLLQKKNELFYNISTPCFMQMITISLHFWGGAAPELPLNIEVFLTCSNSTSALHCLHCLTKLGFTCLSALPSQVSEANVLFGQFSGGCPPQMM